MHDNGKYGQTDTRMDTQTIGHLDFPYLRLFGFATSETEVHMVCESELNNWQSWLVYFRPLLVEATKSCCHHLVKVVED